MGYIAGTKLVQVHWNVNAGDEEAVMTFHLEPSSVVKTLDDLAEGIYDRWVDQWDTIKASYSSALKVDYFRVYNLDVDGHATASATKFTNLSGTSGGLQLPIEVACCVNTYNFDPDTLVANRGRKRGRWYFPSPVSVRLSEFGGYFSDDHIQDHLDFSAAFFASFQADGFGEQPAIASRVDSLNYSIEYVRVDNVPDVQRRRRRQATPTTRYTAPVPY